MKFPAFESINLNYMNADFDVINLKISEVIADHAQPRKTFDPDALQELAISIKQHGVIQPVIVLKINDNQYQLITGERRWRAAKLAGLEKIPAIIKNADVQSRLAIGLIENIQRENLNPLEEAHALQRLLDECLMTHNDVAECVGKSRATISNLLRLLTLTDEVKQMMNDGLLEMGHARALLSLEKLQQIEIANIIVQKKLSVRETEKLIQKIVSIHYESLPALNVEFKEKAFNWETDLTWKLSSKVNVHCNDHGKGKIIIHFDNIEKADWLMKNIFMLDQENK